MSVSGELLAPTEFGEIQVKAYFYYLLFDLESWINGNKK